jgi:uncharacterized protein HemY
MDDPRLWMAEVYRAVRNQPNLKTEFNQQINSCEGPDHAIQICKKFLMLASVSKA